MLTEKILSKPVSFFTPVLSTVTGALKSFILKNLPKNYIQDFFINTEIPLRDIESNTYKMSTPSNIESKNLPLLAFTINPIIDRSEFEIASYWEKTNMFFDQDRSKRIFFDDNNLRFLGYNENRIKIQYKITFVVQTDLKAWNLMYYLRNTLPLNSKKYINGVVTINEIPTDILNLIWRDMGLSENKTPQEMLIFKDYLDRMTGSAIELTLHPATSRNSFCFGCLTNMLTTFNGLDVSIEREGNVVKRGLVSLDLEVDIPVPTLFMYAQNYKDPNLLPEPKSIFETPTETVVFMDDAFLRHPSYYSEDNLAKVFFSSFVFENPQTSIGISNTDYDETDFSGVIPIDIKNLLLTNEQENPNKVLVKVWKGEDELPISDFIFDIDTLTLIIDKTSLFFNYKYYIAIYTDITNKENFALDEELKQIRQIQNEFKY